MIFAKVLKSAVALAAMPLVMTASAAQSQNANTPQNSDVPQHGNWNIVVSKTETGHNIGNPEAEVQLIEFISYTCPHCASFAREGSGALQLAYIGSGRLNLEVRHIIRDPLDLTAAMLSNCGDPSNFPRNHAAFMFSQGTWLPIASNSTAAQRQRWTSGTGTSSRRAIARDFGFYDLMEHRGYSRTDIDRCLADEANAARLTEASAASFTEYSVAGTPSFAIDGVLLLATHNWASLETQLAARF